MQFRRQSRPGVGRSIGQRPGIGEHVTGCATVRGQHLPGADGHAPGVAAGGVNAITGGQVANLNCVDFRPCGDAERGEVVHVRERAQATEIRKRFESSGRSIMPRAPVAAQRMRANHQRLGGAGRADLVNDQVRTGRVGNTHREERLNAFAPRTAVRLQDDGTKSVCADPRESSQATRTIKAKASRIRRREIHEAGGRDRTDVELRIAQRHHARSDVEHITRFGRKALIELKRRKSEDFLGDGRCRPKPEHHGHQQAHARASVSTEHTIPFRSIRRACRMTFPRARPAAPVSLLRRRLLSCWSPGHA